MKPDNSPPSNYDLVAYPSYTHPQTHPARLGVIGALFGLTPARPEGCRVLELGCGNGSNLVPMAASYAASEFVGIDLAARPIAHGQRMIEELGLQNVRLVHGNLTEINHDWGKFDYILAHGLFSWVPAGVREEILRLCRDHLNPQGLAFISYNALPGSHLRLMLREMMLFHVRGFDSPPERVQQAQALAKFLADSQNNPDEYRLWLKSELECILDHDEGHIFHDELADCNEPFYFHQFIELAGRHGLQYVGEADYFEMSGNGFTEATRRSLAQISQNRILREQYLDFLKCRRFRQTLLCHREIPLNNEPQSAPVSHFLVASAAKCSTSAVDLNPGAVVSYQTPKGAVCTTDYVLGKAALSVLEQSWPVPLAFAEALRLTMTSLTRAGINPADDSQPEQKLAAFFLELFGAGVVEFRTSLPPIAWGVGEKPVASSESRWQARQGDVVTSRLHVAVKVQDEVGRRLLTALDGSKDRQDLLKTIQELLKDGPRTASPGESGAEAIDGMRLDLEKNLAKLAQMGLLVG